jgi:hypothetical protein
MDKLPASTGWHWVKQGFKLFRKQPGGLLALFFCCMFLSIVFLIVPLLGSVAPVVLAPIFSIALLQGCAHVDQGRRALPKLALIGFRKPARSALLGLGVLYLLVLLLAMTVLSWMDGGVLIKMATRQIPMDQSVLDDSRAAIFTASGIYLLGWLLSCLATPLIYWQKMSLFKALFFSVVTVVRGIKAFLTGGAILFVIYQIASAIPVLLFDSPQLEATSIFTVFLLLVVVVHCMLYASYCSIFGPPPELPPAPAAKP